jgi:hypothetical protein
LERTGVFQQMSTDIRMKIDVLTDWRIGRGTETSKSHSRSVDGRGEVNDACRLWTSLTKRTY